MWLETALAGEHRMKINGPKTIAICAMLLVILPGSSRANWWDYYVIIQAGGQVQDVSRMENEARQYVQDLNKLNLVASTIGSAREKFVAWQAMEKTIGDGSGVPVYIPSQIAASSKMQQEIDRYAQNLPDTPEGAYLQDYLRRQRQRDQVIQAYSARLRVQAQTAGQSSLTLEQCAALGNALADLGYDNRLLQINEEAEANSVKGIERDDQLKMREYRLLRQESDATWAKK
jgi:hypothetical protein